MGLAPPVPTPGQALIIPGRPRTAEHFHDPAIGIMGSELVAQQQHGAMA